MAAHLAQFSWLLLIFSCALLVSCYKASHEGESKIYVVYMGDLPKGDFSPSSLHSNMLQEALGSKASDSLLYSYKRSFNGFVAKLTEEEGKKLSEMEGVVSVFPNEKMELHTTRSWDFLGFSEKTTRTKVESDVIIAMLDTGIWPESESFDDEGFGPPPTKWKGSCQSSETFNCNNKIIGAKYFRADGQIPKGDFPSPRDTEGHGTHTSSTAAGRLVSNTNLFGLGSGTARGGVPSARIAVYKICWSDGCFNADMLAAFDEAIADGVDIISISVGGFSPQEYFNDAIAIGSFHAMKNNILTSMSAGNSGPGLGSIANFSPWSLSVAASTIDRKFVANVELGNGKIYKGVSVNTFDLERNMYPLTSSADVESSSSTSVSRVNVKNSTNGDLKGTIVLNNNLNNGEKTLAIGAVGAIMQSDDYQDIAYLFPLPTTVLSYNDAYEVTTYINETRKPTATIEKSTQIKDQLAPYVVSFSSRGPNPITSDILKPDLSAPGVDILAAWSEGATVTGLIGDKRVVPYNIISGTSMACPHVSGVAAYVKSFHPNWSPAAIKSALMTTASPMSASINTDAEFAYGSGQISPIRVTDPGLVYDARELDYVKFLCGQGYDDKSLKLVTGDKTTSCSSTINETVWDLNYPSFTLSGPNEESITRFFHRTVTNVGAGSTYKAIVIAPRGMKVEVNPSVISFKSVGEEQSFVVEVSVKISENVLSGSLIWDDGTHRVRSPIVAYAST